MGARPPRIVSTTVPEPVSYAGVGDQTLSALQRLSRGVRATTETLLAPKLEEKGAEAGARMAEQGKKPFLNPFPGIGADAYNKAAVEAYEGSIGNTAQRQYNDLLLRHQEDPDGAKNFAADWEGVKAKLLPQSSRGDMLKIKLDGMGVDGYGRLASLAMQRSHESSRAGLEATEERLLSEVQILARSDQARALTLQPEYDSMVDGKVAAGDLPADDGARAKVSFRQLTLREVELGKFHNSEDKAAYLRRVNENGIPGLTPQYAASAISEMETEVRRAEAETEQYNHKRDQAAATAVREYQQVIGGGKKASPTLLAQASAGAERLRASDDVAALALADAFDSSAAGVAAYDKIRGKPVPELRTRLQELRSVEHTKGVSRVEDTTEAALIDRHLTELAANQGNVPSFLAEQGFLPPTKALDATNAASFADARASRDQASALTGMSIPLIAPDDAKALASTLKQDPATAYAWFQAFSAQASPKELDETIRSMTADDQKGQRLIRGMMLLHLQGAPDHFVQEMAFGLKVKDEDIKDFVPEGGLEAKAFGIMGDQLWMSFANQGPDTMEMRNLVADTAVALYKARVRDPNYPVAHSSMHGYDDATMKEAVAHASGGVVTFGEQVVPPPKYGMTQDQFDTWRNSLSSDYFRSLHLPMDRDVETGEPTDKVFEQVANGDARLVPDLVNGGYQLWVRTVPSDDEVLMSAGFAAPGLAQVYLDDQGKQPLILGGRDGSPIIDPLTGKPYKTASHDSLEMRQGGSGG